MKHDSRGRRKSLRNSAIACRSTQPEIYAREAIHLHERPTTELKLQALRIGDLGITAIPNEVFAITGLKLKAQSPLHADVQHRTGQRRGRLHSAAGTTHARRLHDVAGAHRRARGAGGAADRRDAAGACSKKSRGNRANRSRTKHGPYARAVLESKPNGYWRLNEIALPAAIDAIGKHDATFEDGVAFYLPGVGSGTGVSPDTSLEAVKLLRLAGQPRRAFRRRPRSRERADGRKL